MTKAPFATATAVSYNGESHKDEMFWRSVANEVQVDMGTENYALEELRFKKISGLVLAKLGLDEDQEVVDIDFKKVHDIVLAKIGSSSEQKIDAFDLKQILDLTLAKMQKLPRPEFAEQTESISQVGTETDLKGNQGTEAEVEDPDASLGKTTTGVLPATQKLSTTSTTTKPKTTTAKNQAFTTKPVTKPNLTTKAVIKPKATTKAVIKPKATTKSVTKPKATTKSVTKPKATTKAVIKPIATTKAAAKPKAMPIDSSKTDKTKNIKPVSNVKDEIKAKPVAKPNPPKPVIPKGGKKKFYSPANDEILNEEDNQEFIQM